MAPRRERLESGDDAVTAHTHLEAESRLPRDLVRSLADLLQHLDVGQIQTPEIWCGWCIAPVSGGANNLLFRVTGDAGDYAVKFTVRDARDRAGREYAALSALRQAGLDIAPRPIWLDRERHAQPVVVQTWLNGEALSRPPQTDAEWAALLDHYGAIHSVTPQRTTVPLASGYVNVSSGEAGKAMVHEHARMLPLEVRPASLREILAWLDGWSPPTWPTPPRTLVRVDGNWRNFVACGDALASVDWEYSGWGDPAFELSELALHPAYDGVPQERWEQFLMDYARRHNDPTVNLRVRTYTTIMLVWWLVRWTRYLYEVPRGMDARLVSRPAGWLAEVERQYGRYLARTEQINF